MLQRTTGGLRRHATREGTRNDQTPTTTNRGLGWHRQQTRTRLLAPQRHPLLVVRPPHVPTTRRQLGPAPLEADHTIARSQGGRTADRLLHMTCNRERGDGTRDHLARLAGHSAPPATDEPDDLRIMPWPW